MSDVIRKCPKDGTEFGDTFADPCPVCNGPVAFYCKKHNDWLTGAVCPKCSGQPATPTPKPAPPHAGVVPVQPGFSADVVFVIGIVVLLVVLIGVLVFAVQRYVRKPTKPTAPPATTTVTQTKPAPTPAPPPVAPTTPSVPVKTDAGPAFPTYPPASVTMADVLRDPDKFDGKLVQVSGTSQFVEADKFTFDLRDGNRTLQVFYRDATPQSKATVAGNSRLVVTGLLKRLEQEDAWQIVAQSIEAR